MTKVGSEDNGGREVCNEDGEEKKEREKEKSEKDPHGLVFGLFAYRRDGLTFLGTKSLNTLAFFSSVTRSMSHKTLSGRGTTLQPKKINKCRNRQEGIWDYVYGLNRCLSEQENQ